MKKHVFITATGALLPRWVQAFPNSVAVTPGNDIGSIQADVIWLRLQASLPAAQQVQAIAGAGPLIVLSDIPNDDEALIIFSMAARGYANSHVATETLKQIARVVGQGGLWLGESLMQRMLTGVQSIASVDELATPVKYKLTDRELEVAQSIAAGASNKDVARQLDITERTVKAHVSHLFAKLGVQDRLQLALKMRDIAG